HPDDVLRIGQYRMVYRDSAATEAQPEPESATAFRIEAASVELNELQKRSGLLELADREALAESSVELRTLELLHEVGVRLARTVTTADVMETAVDLLFKIEGVHRATLMQCDEEQQVFRVGD